MRKTSIIIGTVTVVLVVFLGVVLVYRSKTQPLMQHTASAPVTWLISGPAIINLENAGATPALVNAAFSSSYVIGHKTSVNIGIPTGTYTSYADIKNALDNNSIPPSVKAVIYDNENWQFTPLEEQKNPALYEHMVANLLHRHGLLYIATPAVDLVKILEPNAHVGSLFQAYLNLGIARDAAKYADIFEIQAQGSEDNIPKFSDFVSSAMTQAKQANPNVKVFVGISTNPNGKTITADQLYGAYVSVRSFTGGYWLNIPSQSAYCPRCGKPQPQIGLTLLQKVYQQN